MAGEIFYQWIALAILFCVANIWGEDDVRFGYILVPFMAGFFLWVKWLTFSYLGTLIPILIVMGIVTFLRAQLRYKYGYFGSSGSLLWKIVTFVVFIQFAIVFINGLAIFNGNFAETPTASTTTDLYSISSAQSVYGESTYDLSIADVVSGGITLFWTSLKVLWSLVLGFFTMYPTMINTFQIPPSVAALVSAGIYLLTAFEVFAMIYKPMGKPEV
jgi:hypothetical protein